MNCGVSVDVYAVHTNLRDYASARYPDTTRERQLLRPVRGRQRGMTSATSAGKSTASTYSFAVLTTSYSKLFFLLLLLDGIGSGGMAL